jgi:hypothetical protein
MHSAAWTEQPVPGARAARHAAALRDHGAWVLRCGEMGRAEMSPAHRSACASIHLPPRCLRHQGEVSTWHTAEALLLARLLCLQMLHIGIHHVRGPFVRFTCARSARPPHGLGGCSQEEKHERWSRLRSSKLLMTLMRTPA